MNTDSKIIEKTTHKCWEYYVYRVKVSELNPKHCSKMFHQKKLDENLEVFVKCDEDGDIDYRERGKKLFEYRIIPIN